MAEVRKFSGFVRRKDLLTKGEIDRPAPLLQASGSDRRRPQEASAIEIKRPFRQAFYEDRKTKNPPAETKDFRADPILRASRSILWRFNIL
jgi:hypothetical protein